jgi:glycolate oxidase
VAQAAPDALRIYQLYVRGDDAFVDDYIARATACGYTAFCFTVDSAIYSRRERDLAKRHVTAGRRSVAQGRRFQAAFAWRDIAHARKVCRLPIVLKGIATHEDARMAVEHGVDWIYVSNHGGRQLDHGPGTMEVLPEIVDAVKDKAKIMIDGGFCRGTDIVKAIAAGADLVGLGRMQCYALAAAGDGGLVRMLEILEDEVQRCLGLLGVTRFADLDATYLRAALPAAPAHVLSAFPLLRIDDHNY